jgi:Fe2+ or Zn2+ uptake regulation protein
LKASENVHKAAEEKLREYIRSKQMRPSRVRNMVLEQVCLLPAPFTAEQLIEACAPERISVGTVYNALRLFVDAEIIHGIMRQRGRMTAEYEVITKEHNTFQIICPKCGRVANIDDKAITRLITERKYSNFRMGHFNLYVYGECKLCRRKIAKGI